MFSQVLHDISIRVPGGDETEARGGIFIGLITVTQKFRKIGRLDAGEDAKNFAALLQCSRQTRGNIQLPMRRTDLEGINLLILVKFHAEGFRGDLFGHQQRNGGRRLLDYSQAGRRSWSTNVVW